MGERLDATMSWDVSLRAALLSGIPSGFAILAGAVT